MVAGDCATLVAGRSWQLIKLPSSPDMYDKDGVTN